MFLFVCWYFCFAAVMAQNKQGFTFSPPTSANLDKATVVDTGYLRISYAFNADSIDNINTYIDLQCLEIGNNISKYYSRFVSNSDSLCHIWRKEHPKAQNLPRWLGEGGRYKNRWSEYQFSEIFKTAKDLTVYSRMPMYFNRNDSWHTEAYPLQQCKIDADTLYVCGDLCQKAV